MADGYLEKHQQDYEARKAAWLRKKRAVSVALRRQRLLDISEGQSLAQTTERQP